MAQRDVAGFKATKNARYAANTSGDISSGDGADTHEDVADSFLNLTDGGTVTNIVTIQKPAQSLVVKSATTGYSELSVRSGVSDEVQAQFQAIGGATNKVIIGARTNHPVAFNVNDTEAARIDTSGRFGIGTTPTAKLHLPAGTTTANTAPLKLTTGTALTTPEDGAIEYHSSHLYFTIGSTRYQLDQQASNATSGTYSPTFTSNLNLDSTPVATALTAKYVRLGNNVTVTLYANVDPTATGQYSFYVTLPIASNLTSVTQLIGHGGNATGDVAEIIGDITNDRAMVTATTTSTALHSIYLTFTYEVL